MKTILQILIILLIGALVSGGLYLIVQNTSLGSSTNGPSLDQRPAPVSGDVTQPMTRPEGGSDHDSASLSRGLSEVGVSLAKLTGITAVVLLIQALFARINKRQVSSPAAA